MNDTIKAINFFVGWFVILGGLWLLALTNWGKPIVYYSLWLLVLLTIVVHANELTQLISNTGLLDQVLSKQQ